MLLRWSAEGEVSVEVNAAISEATRILEASNICPAAKKALHLCKALISLVFLAPRPGLEPGTYGLTVVSWLILRDCMRRVGIVDIPYRSMG